MTQEKCKRFQISAFHKKDSFILICAPFPTATRSFFNLPTLLNRLIMRFKLLPAIFLVWGSFIAVSAQKDADRRVLLQGFYYNAHNVSGWYNILAANAQSLKNSGVDMVWMPPPSQSGSPNGYLPEQLYNFNNAYGSEAQHRAAINAFKSVGIEPLADIVINHRNGSGNCWNFSNPSWPTYYTVNTDSGVNIPECRPVPQLSVNSDSGSEYLAARDLDHKNPAVRAAIKEFMDKLKNDLGYVGWRYDLVHGYGAGYLGEYNFHTNPSFSVGENWTDANNTWGWIQGTGNSTTAFDFETRSNILSAIKYGSYQNLGAVNGSMYGLLGKNSKYATTFVDNHDTDDPSYCGSYCGTLNSGNIVQGYAYILTHPGVPQLYWKHYMDWGVRGEIDAILKVRKESGIHSQSSVSIQRSEQGLYAAVIDGKVAVKLGGNNWAPSGSGWTLKASGNNYAVWSKNDIVPPPPPPPPPPQFAVSFVKPASWANTVKVYTWGCGTAMAWPGISMTANGNTYTANIGGGSCNLIFNDGNGKQTVDLTQNATSTFTANATANATGKWEGNWGAVPPVDPPFSVTFIKPSSWGTNVRVYTWGCGTAMAWPGVSLTQISSGIYEGSIGGGNCNLIFNDGTKQTIDLTRKAAGLFTANANANNLGKWEGTWGTTPIPPTPNITGVIFNKPASWASAVKIYIWGCGASMTWPGVDMNVSSTGAYNYPANEGCNVIFSDGAGKQTVDLVAVDGGYFTTTGVNAQGKWVGNWAVVKGAGNTIAMNETPQETQLFSAYPNPFSTTTTLSFNLNSDQAAKLTVYNVLGQQMVQLTDEFYKAGTYRFEVDATQWTSGMYIYRLETTDGKVMNGTMTLMK